ncbi:MAG: hypothetical protein LBS20_01425 [Prevotella sp.]|jgi:hypothetical protein|nr:hypothetical protein [Prevotella sp.]
MKIKQYFIAALSLLFVFPVYSQSVKTDLLEQRKFVLSVHAGLDFPLGTSNTVLPHDLPVPFAKRGFIPGMDGAWFFTENYGVGVKYRYYMANDYKYSYSEYTEQTYEYPVFEKKEMSFYERTHAFGPALFARWPLGSSKWVVSANAGVMYMYNKLYHIKQKTRYDILYDYYTLFDDSEYPHAHEGQWDNIAGNTFGLSLSAGIRYRITPLISAGVSANGLFGSLSLSEIKRYSLIDNRYATTDISRKINRIGLSAAIDFNF